MKQEEIEMLAFFYLCDEKDRNILMKREKMTFRDFQRFDYLTRRLEFWEYNKKIWKDFAGEFEQKIQRWGNASEISDEIEMQEIWWEKLSKNKKDLLDFGSDYC